MPSCNTYCLTWVSLILGVGYLFTAAPAKRSHCSLPWTRGISSPPPFLTFSEVTGKFGLGIRNETGQRLIEFCQENALVITNTLFKQHKRRLYTWTSPDGQTKIRLITFFAAKDGEALYSQQKQDQELTVAQIMNSLLPIQT